MKHRTGTIAGLFIVLAVAGFALASPARAESIRFAAHLSGKDMLPKAVATKATGLAVFWLSKDGKELFYRLRVRNIDDVTMAHIHMGSVDKIGLPVVQLYPKNGMMQMEKHGRFSGILARGRITEKALIGPLQGKPLKALVDGIKSGDMYVIVHTAQHPDGELRGLIK